MGPDEFSDPFIIPITITIPNPARRPPSGPFNRGQAHHPSFTDPDWFARQRSKITLTQLVGPIPFPPLPLPLPQRDEALATLKELRAYWARARRRAGHIEDELGAGDYDSAAGHLLLGSPFPAEVDSGFVLNNEAGRPTLGDMVDETKKDIEKRLNDPLDERHREATRNDILGKPLVDSRGRIRWHDEEVATNANGLEDRAKALDKKAEYDKIYGDPALKPIIDDAKAVSDKIRSILSDLSKEIPGLDKLREEVRKTGTIKRQGGGSSS